LSNLKAVKELFSKELNKALFKTYRKKVSIVFFVNQFNLRAHGAKVIAYETGRKWLKGIALPQSSKIKILVDWLGLDVATLFSGSVEDDNVDKNKISTLVSSSLISESAHRDHLLDYIYSTALELDPKHLSSLLLAALTLKEFSYNSSLNFDQDSFIDKIKLALGIESR
jgi:hypothetical protein